MARIIYIHGMGGGSDSRIPSILRDHLPAEVELDVRTYDFDPEKATEKIRDWVEDYKPDLVVGESLGALHALKLPNVKRILVSPALGAASWLRFFGILSFIPGITPLLDRIYRPRPGDRQSLHFTWKTLKKYKRHYSEAVSDNGGSVFAFFGKKDHYLKWKIVNIKKYRKLYGDDYIIYDGSHFMEEEFVISMLLPKIIEKIM